MYLRYINIWLNPETGFDDNYRYQFTLRTRFISNFLSVAIRKIKFATDGTFNMISIAPNPQNQVGFRIRGLDSLSVSIPFEKDRYDKIRGSDNFNYYLELFREGFEKASEFKKIPLEALLNIIKEFEANGCKNEWLHKKKRFKEHDIEVILTCEFTTNYFQLIATINQISIKKQLVKGVIMKTEPDEIFYDKMFKDVLIDKNIIITDSSNTKRIVISKKDVFDYKLNFKILGDGEIKKMLTYQL
jgi:hypothetical protein